MKRMVAMLLALGILAQPLEVRADDFLAEECVWQMATDIAKPYNICPELIEAIAWHESRFKADAVNGSCKGIMQTNASIHQEKMKELGIDDLYEPYDSIRLGTAIFADYLEMYDGEAYVALVAYNCGENSKNVQRALDGKTCQYAEEVMKKSQELEREHGK